MNARFKLALEQFSPARWSLFEDLAGRFLADEFPGIRRLADSRGDGGRDADLYTSGDYSHIVLQYSVSADAERKVRETAAVLNKKHPEVTELIYVTNRAVPTATRDALKSRLRKHNRLSLDFRDQGWFLDRTDRSAATTQATEKVCKILIEPLLLEAGVIRSAPMSLTDEDAKAALLFLALQREDDTQERGLTKLCFDALARAVLRRTDNEHRLSRVEVHETASKLLPSHPSDEVAMYIDRALERLERHAIRHWTKTDEFCLTYPERVRVTESLARFELRERDFEDELLSHAQSMCDLLQAAVPPDLEALTLRARRVLERYLFGRGEEFVAGLAAGQIPMLIQDELRSIAQADLNQYPDTSAFRHKLTDVLEGTLSRLLQEPTDATLHYLHSINSAYTLFAFLRETPNVQAAITKVFAGGELFLDTSVILPLMAEELLEPDERKYGRLFDAARSAGVELRTTYGVIEELVSHLARCRTAHRVGANFRGSIPFLVNAHLWSGRSPDTFLRYLEEFAGESRSEADLISFLVEERGIATVSLERELATADDTLRWQVMEFWRDVHSRRRDASIADDIIDRLAKHDTESYLGIVQRRGGELIANPLGYTTWWLTLDTAAFTANRKIEQRAGVLLDSPVMTLESLGFYLTVGEVRKQMQKRSVSELPLSLDLDLLEVLPDELRAAAAQIRSDFAGQSERVIRRKIRDLVEADRLRSGKGRMGIELIEHDIQMSLQAYAKGAGR